MRSEAGVQAVAGVASAASAAGALVTSDAAVALFGVPLPVILAAFAGAGLILSFLPPRKLGIARMLGTVVFCTLLGAYGAPAATKWLAAHDYVIAGASLVAFVIAAVGQILLPLAIERRAELFERIFGRKS